MDIKVERLIDDDPNNPDYKARCSALAVKLNEEKAKNMQLNNELTELRKIKKVIESISTETI